MYIILLAFVMMVIEPKLAVAETVEVIGNDTGFVVEPRNTSLFDLNNMRPGDEVVASIWISNRYNEPFRLYLRIDREDEQPRAGEPDLYNKLIVAVRYGKEEIYNGYLAPIDLGSFAPGTRRNLIISVHLPGRDIGDEYQNTQLKTKWVFIPQLGKDESCWMKSENLGSRLRMPKTGESMAYGFYGVGIGLVLLGLIIDRDRN